MMIFCIIIYFTLFTGRSSFTYKPLGETSLRFCHNLFTRNDRHYLLGKVANTSYMTTITTILIVSFRVGREQDPLPSVSKRLIKCMSSRDFPGTGYSSEVVLHSASLVSSTPKGGAWAPHAPCWICHCVELQDIGSSVKEQKAWSYRS